MLSIPWKWNPFLAGGEFEIWLRDSGAEDDADGQTEEKKRRTRGRKGGRGKVEEYGVLVTEASGRGGEETDGRERERESSLVL